MYKHIKHNANCRVLQPMNGQDSQILTINNKSFGGGKSNRRKSDGTMLTQSIACSLKKKDNLYS